MPVTDWHNSDKRWIVFCVKCGEDTPHEIVYSNGDITDDWLRCQECKNLTQR